MNKRGPLLPSSKYVSQLASQLCVSGKQSSFDELYQLRINIEHRASESTSGNLQLEMNSLPLLNAAEMPLKQPTKLSHSV
jgi:hypothetical protein